MANKPYFLLEISGERQAKDFYNKKVVDPITDSIERTLKLIDTEAYQTVGYTSMDSVSRIWAYSASTVTIKIDYNDGTAKVIELPFTGVFIYDIDSTFAGNVTDITFKTDSATEISVDIRFYSY